MESMQDTKSQNFSHFKGCNSNLEVNIFQFLKVATNEISTLQ